MKLIKLNKFEEFVTAEKAEEIYFNADNIISVRPKSNYSEIEIVYPYGLRRVKVQETIEEIQYQLDGKPAETKVEVDKKLVGRQIRKIRREKGMTLEEFGKIFGATKGNVAKWENGQSLPCPNRLKEIADLAGMIVQELLEGKNYER